MCEDAPCCGCCPGGYDDRFEGMDMLDDYWTD